MAKVIKTSHRLCLSRQALVDKLFKDWYSVPQYAKVFTAQIQTCNPALGSISLQLLFQALVVGLVKQHEFAKRYLVSRQACCADNALLHCCLNHHCLSHCCVAQEYTPSESIDYSELQEAFAEIEAAVGPK